MPRSGLLLPALSAAAIAMTGATAQAATLTVNTPIDSITPGTGQCSLREAIQDVDSPGTASGGCAPASFGTNTIVLGQGTYPLRNGLGELKVTPQVTNLTIEGRGVNNTVIDASGLADRILEIQAGASVSVSDLTLTGGHAPDGAAGQSGSSPAGASPGQAGANGGAILNAGTLTLTDAAITNSLAGQGGAGGGSMIFSFGPGFDGGAGGHGGDGGAIFNTGNLILTDVTVAGNRAGTGGNGGLGEQGSPGGDGGAGGAAGAGGAVGNQGGDVTITGSTIRGNSAGTGGAGGMGGSDVNSASSVGGPGGPGTAGGDGGGVWTDGGLLTVTNCTLVSNTAGNGGGAGAGGFGGGSGGNGGGGGAGGGISVAGVPVMRLVNLTVVDNSAGAGGAAVPSGASGGGASGGSGNGGGIATSGAAVPIQNSLLALNPDGNCAPGSVLDGGHNLTFGDSTCPATFASGDPKLGPLEDNGGPTQTISLGAGSAAVDQIPSGACPATDQRGVARPTGSVCDIGAYEVAPPVAGAASGVGAVRASGRHAVTIVAVITPNAGQARVWVEYGRTQHYGQRSAVHTVAGVTPANVSIRLSGLNLDAAYHYRIVVVSIDGKSQTGDRRLAMPILGALVLAPDPVRAAGSRGGGTTMSYTDARPALTTFAVQRLRHGKWVTLGEFRHRDRVGRNRVYWGGRLSGRRVAPGAYRLSATPQTAGATGPASTVRFKIIG